LLTCVVVVLVVRPDVQGATVLVLLPVVLRVTWGVVVVLVVRPEVLGVTALLPVVLRVT
jgi:hypothetical protein